MMGVHFDLLVISSPLLDLEFFMLECQSAVSNSWVFKIIGVDENALIRTIFWNGRIYSGGESSLLLAAVSSLFKATISLLLVQRNNFL